ncbi:MAG: DEAD/DEAH box helicase [Oscillospiraceae bacterium]|nr:DEAD/DEAH box helicase [Oscillospiraceae bacterium]
MNPCTGVVYSYAPLPGAEEEIYSRIADITVSMKALDCLDMPGLVTVPHRVEMNASERALYAEMKQNLLLTLAGEKIDAANAAVLSGKLLQMANGALYDSAGGIIPIHNRKLEVLADLIEQSNGQSVLVTYWYRHDHGRIMEYLHNLGFQPRDIRTEADIDDWNAGRIRIGLLSPAGAGHGLNLQQGGHILIWFSMIWSLELYQQTVARLWRQGQKEPVSVHHIVCGGTVDEDALEALARKDTTQQRLIEAVKARLAE